VKTTTIALFSAVLITIAPTVHAHNISTKTPHQHHRAFNKGHQLVSSYAPWGVRYTTDGVKTGYLGASSYAPSVPKDYTYDNSRNGGGGGGGGGM
jgi:hypothetical protein